MKIAYLTVCHALWRLPQRLLMAAVQAYRVLLSPWLGSACRFTPSCSVYALQALDQHGALRGSYLTLRRLGRCQPWCVGGHDPVPLRPVFPGTSQRVFSPCSKPNGAETVGSVSSTFTQRRRHE